MARYAREWCSACRQPCQRSGGASLSYRCGHTMRYSQLQSITCSNYFVAHTASMVSDCLELLDMEQMSTCDVTAVCRAAQRFQCTLQMVSVQLFPRVHAASAGHEHHLLFQHAHQACMAHANNSRLLTVTFKRCVPSWVSNSTCTSLWPLRHLCCAGEILFR